MPAETIARRLIHFSDSGQLADFFVGWNGKFEQISTGNFAGSLDVVKGASVRVVSAQFNQKLLVRGHAAPGLCSFYLVERGNADSLWHGRQLSPGQIVMHGPQGTTDHRTARRSIDYGLTMAAEEFHESVRTLLGATHPAIPNSWGAFDTKPDAHSTLHQRMCRLLNYHAFNSMQPISPESRQIEQECVRSVVQALFEEGRSCEPQLSFPSRAALVRKADDLMRSRIGEPLGAIDLCAQLGVSDRTLRLAFRERFGLGPMAYFQAIRLNAVRAALQSATIGDGIAPIAQRHGFCHLGNFAAAYRRLFGERPSATFKNRIGTAGLNGTRHRSFTHRSPTCDIP